MEHSSSAQAVNRRRSSRPEPTSSPLFWRQMNLPSVSISSTQTGPVAEAAWEMDTELLASCSSTSTRFLLP